MTLRAAIAALLRAKPALAGAAPAAHPDETARQATLARALQQLRDAGIDTGDAAGAPRFVLSPEHRYCAMTLANHESWVVDLERGRHAHYPAAGVAAMTGHRLLLEPDAVRFSLEPTGDEAFEVDLQADDLPWQPGGH